MQRLPGNQQQAAPGTRPHAPRLTPAPIQPAVPPFVPPRSQVPRSPASVPAPAAAPSPSLVLRRHPLALVPRLAMLIALIGIVVVVSWLRGDGRLLALGALVGLAAGTFQVAAWRSFCVTIRYDRVKVRRLGLFFVRQTTYLLPGVLGLACEQTLFDRPLNTGTIILALPNRTLRLTMLRPYSAINRIMGW